MLTSLILVGVGLLLILLELVLPGGVIGSVGAVTVATGLILFGIFSHSSFWTVVVALTTLCVLSFAVYLILKKKKEEP